MIRQQHIAQALQNSVFRSLAPIPSRLFYEDHLRKTRIIKWCINASSVNAEIEFPAAVRYRLGHNLTSIHVI